MTVDTTGDNARPDAAVANQRPMTAAKKTVPLVGRQQDFDSAYRLAQNLALSSIIPKDLRGKPADVLVILLYGQELGIPVMQAMQVIDVMHGRPNLRANLWVALTRRAGHKVRVTAEDATSCTVAVTRHDDPEPVVVTYTLDDAKIAGLLTNDNYRKNPKSMLYARAASTAIRRAAPEVAMGFADEYEPVADPPAAAPRRLREIAAARGRSATAGPDRDDDALLAELVEVEHEHAADPDADRLAEQLAMEADLAGQQP